MPKYFVLLLLVTQCVACSSQSQSTSNNISSDAPVLTKDYWYDGSAEINTYELKQNRYNTLHDGTAMLIFVTEDFLTDKQVKNDNYQNKNSTSVLKKIEQRKFNTGVYDYTIYSTVFTPVEINQYKKSFKVVGSSQEWCGTTYNQFNAQKNGYKAIGHSYFEAEGDIEVNIPSGIHEGELYTRLRMNPELLPIGAFDIIPDPIVGRMLHYPLQSFEAEANISDYSGDLEGENLKQYSITMPDAQRTLEIVYEAAAPFKIVAFYDSYPSVFDKQIRTTSAVLINQSKLPYWSKNNTSDEVLRTELKLD
jgi:hypothetical protein